MAIDTSDPESWPMGYLDEQITERKRALGDLDRRRIVLEAELRILEDVRAHQAEEAAADHGGANGFESPQMPAVAAFNRMTPEWQSVIRTLAPRQSFRANDMLEVGTERGMLTLTMLNVRSQLTLLTQRGILRRISEGEYAVAEEIAAMSG
jgi:hypothetical protein